MGTKIKATQTISIVLPTYNERENITPIIDKLFETIKNNQVEIIIVDDNSSDGTTDLIRKMMKQDRRINLIHRIDRAGLSSAIKEGVIFASGEIVAIMDSDGQHEASAILNAVNVLENNYLDIVIGSRFLDKSNINGLSSHRKKGSSLANKLSRLSLSSRYKHITDYMSGCIVLRRNSCIKFISKVDVNGFKFLYELLSISNGLLKIEEIPLIFQPRYHGKSKLDVAILWDFVISLLHTLSLRSIPRRAISFGIVGLSGVLVQLLATLLIRNIFLLSFENALPFAVFTAATSNYLINNALTFRNQRLKNWRLVKGLLKFLIVASLPLIASVGLATGVHNILNMNIFWSQISGILVVFVWNYIASSKFVWNTPS